MDNNSQIIIYRSEDGNIKIDATFEDETVWLNQAQIAILLEKEEPPSRNIFKIFLKKEN